MLGVFIGDQTTLDDAGTDLVNHVLLAHGFPELANTHTHVAHRGNETVTVELSIHLELRHLGDQGIDIRIIEFQTLGVGVLDQDLLLDQGIQHIRADLVFIEHGRIGGFHSG